MGLTEDQARQTKEIAWEVGDTIAKRIKESMDQAIELHGLKCEAKQQIEELRDDISAKTNQAKGVMWAAGAVAAIISAVGGFIGWLLGK